MAVILLLGAGPLAALMAAERTELEWGRASSRVVSAPNASAACFSSIPAAEALSLQESAKPARQRRRVARLAFPHHER